MSMLWNMPPRIKVYEALGAIADNRVEMVADNSAKVTSSSGDKAYEVFFNPETNELSVNDNGSYWQGYVGYPGVAFLMVKKLLPFNQQLAESVKGFQWKAVNQHYKNDFSKTEHLIYQTVSKGDLEAFAGQALTALKKLQLVKPAKRQKPPKGD